MEREEAEARATKMGDAATNAVVLLTRLGDFKSAELLVIAAAVHRFYEDAVREGEDASMVDMANHLGGDLVGYIKDGVDITRRK